MLLLSSYVYYICCLGIPTSCLSCCCHAYGEQSTNSMIQCVHIMFLLGPKPSSPLPPPPAPKPPVIPTSPRRNKISAHVTLHSPGGEKRGRWIKVPQKQFLIRAHMHQSRSMFTSLKAWILVTIEGSPHFILCTGITRRPCTYVFRLSSHPGPSPAYPMWCGRVT